MTVEEYYNRATSALAPTGEQVTAHAKQLADSDYAEKSSAVEAKKVELSQAEAELSTVEAVRNQLSPQPVPEAPQFTQPESYVG